MNKCRTEIWAIFKKSWGQFHLKNKVKWEGKKVLSPSKPFLNLSSKHYQICQNFLIHLCHLSNYTYKFGIFWKEFNHFRYEHATTHYSLSFFLPAKIFLWGKSVWFTWYLKGKANIRSIWASNISYASVKETLTLRVSFPNRINA